MHVRIPVLAAATLMVSVLTFAQAPPANLQALEDLQANAVESDNLTIGPLLLWCMRHFGHAHNQPDETSAEFWRGLHQVQIRSFQFKADYVPAKADVDSLRTQLAAPGWHQLVQVRAGGSGEDVDIYYTLVNHMMTRMAILAVSPHELTLVKIVGSVDLNNVAMLPRTFLPD